MTYNDHIKGRMPKIGQFTKTEVIFYFLLPSTIITTLTLAYFLPAEIKELLTLNYHFLSFSNPSDLLRLYTYHLIHYDFLHFAGNLVSFILIYWILTYLVIQGKEVKMFKVMLLIIFFVIAPALGILDLILFGDTVLKQGCVSPASYWHSTAYSPTSPSNTFPRNSVSILGFPWFTCCSW